MEILHTDTAELTDGTVLTPGSTFRVKGDGSRYRFIQLSWAANKPRSRWIDCVQDRAQPRGGIRSFRLRDVYNVKTGRPRR